MDFSSTVTVRSSLVFVVAALVSACAATLTPAGQMVQVSDERMVAQCKYLGDVQGDSTDTSAARNDARNHAAEMGATNILFVSQTPATGTPGHMESQADSMGRAYKCAGDTAADRGAAPTIAPNP